MPRAAVAVSASVLVSVLAIAGSAAGRSPRPLLRVLNGGWFRVSVHGSYTMSWSANLHQTCGNPTESESLDAQSSETLTFATRRPVRAYLVDTLQPGIRSRPPVPVLLLRRRSYARGAKLGPNDFSPFKTATPATWMRTLSGSYQNCGDAPQSLAPQGCGAFATPRFSTWLYQVSDTRRYHGPIAMPVSERSNSGLPETSCQSDADLPFPSHVIGFLHNSEDVNLRCPSPSAVLRSAKGSTTECHLERRDNGFLPGVREVLTVTFRRG